MGSIDYYIVRITGALPYGQSSYKMVIWKDDFDKCDTEIELTVLLVYGESLILSGFAFCENYIHKYWSQLDLPNNIGNFRTPDLKRYNGTSKYYVSR